MAKSEICHNCCPDGGALFDLNFGSWRHGKTGEMMTEDAWVKVCRNCGHYKPQRKSRDRLTFDEILAQPDASKLRNKRERAIFHAFAEAGAWHAYKNICEAYASECKRRNIGKFPLLMHWALNTFHYDKLAKHSEMTAREIDHHILRLKEDARRGKEILDRDFLVSEAA